jgi:hypothetical protein
MSCEDVDMSKPVYEIPSNVGPWILQEVIYSDKDKVRIATTQDPGWVVKITLGNPPVIDELMNLFMLKQHHVAHTVNVPASISHRFGTGPNYAWFAMRRYEGCILANDFSRIHWRSIAIHVLTFLQDLHLKCGRIYMDIKTTNILYQTYPGQSPQFILADYELIDTIELSKPTRYYSNNTKWYYIAMGAELDEPLYSWRMDFVALAYTLASIIRSYEKKKLWTYYDQCMERRANRLSYDIADESIIALRSTEIQQEHPTIQEYLRIVSEIPWDSATPPSPDMYKRLMSVFAAI